MRESVRPIPKKKRLKGTRTHSRILGCILGGMVGDALAARVQCAIEAGTLKTDAEGTPLRESLPDGRECWPSEELRL